MILTRPPGYVLQADPEHIDACRFANLVDEGLRRLREGLGDEGARPLRSALGMWRGDPLSDFTYEEFAQPHIRRLRALRLTALQELAAVELERAGPERALELVETAIEADPLGERLRELQLVALYRTGRHAEALRVCRLFRRALAEELGLDPSPALRRLEERILLHDPSLGAPSSQGSGADDSSPRNPYKGLRAFGEDDAEDFYGRERLIDDLVTRLRMGALLLCLVGPSGSGKSSVAIAGLVPRIREGTVSGSDAWAVATMQPGRHPFLELRAALERGARTRSEHEHATLLVIDGFEELFSSSEEGVQQRFLRHLGAVAADPTGRTCVVLTLRADFYDRPLLDPGFGRPFSAGVVNVLPMDAAELESAIVRPAGAVGVEVEPALVAALVADSTRQPGPLPLLQYALTELFDRRVASSLTLTSYRELGGLRGLLSRRAKELYGGLSDEERDVAMQVFLRLVRAGDRGVVTGRRTSVGELLSLDLDPVVLAAVLEVFGRQRLLSFDRDPITGDPTVEVAHEALLTGWDRSADWIRRHREDLRRHEALAAAIDEWASADRNPDYLFTGTRLAEHEAWSRNSTIRLSADERRFIHAGSERRDTAERAERAVRERQRRLERRARTRLLGLVAVVVLLIGAITFGGLVTLANRPPAVVLILNTAPFPVGGLLADGLDRAASDFGIRVQKVVSPRSRFEQAIRKASEDGADLVIAAAPDCGDTAERVAAEFPATRYVVFECPGDMPNVIYVRFATEQASFLAGAAAALRSRTGTVGFVAGGDIPPLWPLRAGFEAGARFIDPTIEVPTANLAEGEIGFDREALAFQAARRMYRQGADVIFQAAGYVRVRGLRSRRPGFRSATPTTVGDRIRHRPVPVAGSDRRVAPSHPDLDDQALRPGRLRGPPRFRRRDPRARRPLVRSGERRGRDLVQRWVHRRSPTPADGSPPRDRSGRHQGLLAPA